MILSGRGFLYHVGGRRFLLTVGCGIICTWLVHHKDISDTVFQYTILGTVGAFIAGNTVEAVKGLKNATPD